MTDVVWPVPHRVTDTDAQFFPWRVLIEHCCTRCGQGFSSVKPEPLFCSAECRNEAAAERLAVQSPVLWRSPAFRSKIANARRTAGYPNGCRPEAVARRKMRAAAKNAIHRCLRRRGQPKAASREALLGYTTLDLCRHIETLFVPGMNWLNYGLWEIDHRRPIADFAIDAPIAEINALTNLQPLWKLENRKKSANAGI